MWLGIRSCSIVHDDARDARGVLIALVDAIALLLVDLRGCVDCFSLLANLKLGLVQRLVHYIWTLNSRSRLSLTLPVSIESVILGVVLPLIVLGHRLVLLLLVSSLLTIGNFVFILHQIACISVDLICFQLFDVDFLTLFEIIYDSTGLLNFLVLIDLISVNTHAISFLNESFF